MALGPAGKASGRDDMNPSLFLAAQDPVYASVLAELRAGRKRSHWMWFIFPQIAGLGSSATAARYALASADDARLYERHDVLGTRLRECTSLVLATGASAAGSIFGYPDDLKFRSSMTLFALAAPQTPLFRQAISQFFGGEPDALTVGLLAGQARSPDA